MGQLAMDVGVLRGDISTFTLTLPFLPPSKNVSDNWQPLWKHSAKEKWAKRIKDLADEYRIPRDCDRVGLAVRLVFATKGRRDPQNYAHNLWHWIPDALVQCGVISDDRGGMVEIGPNWGVEMMVDPRQLPKAKKQRTILTIVTEGGVPLG